MEWPATQPSQMACFSEDLKCWEAWDTTCGRKAKDITPSIAWRREALKEEALDDLPWQDERGPSSIRLTFEPFQRQRCGNFWETGWSAYGLFRAHRYHLELNWTENILSKFSLHRWSDLTKRINFCLTFFSFLFSTPVDVFLRLPYLNDRAVSLQPD